MIPAANGCKVVVHYTGTLEDGTVFDSSLDGEPMAFVLGAGEIITGFENAVLGLTTGESTTVVISPEDGYGDYSEDRLLSVPEDHLPEDVDVGSMLQANTPAGSMVFTVKEIEAGTALLDGNHPLAGKTLRFEIAIINVTQGEPENTPECGCSRC